MEQQNNFMIYSTNFKMGFYDVAYSEDTILTEPSVDYSDFCSMGYYDGFQYGIYCQRTSQTLGLSSEQLIAITSKSFSRACDINTNYEKRYIQYKDGFVTGKGDVQLKAFEKDESYNVIPDVIEDNIYSVGYHDGYCFYLNKILNDNNELNLEDDEEMKERIPVDIVAREAYKISFKQYPVFTNKNPQVNK